ncbi:MAG: hypothetical protein H0S80_02735 [Desulfovibrionaceae bacterium]|nr:hypothetical protein [Desulfovibrionaceae bacterium]
MYVETDTAPVLGGYAFETHLRELAEEEAARFAGDVVNLSDEAVAAFREAAIEPIKNGTFTLASLQQRINTVREEIARVWNSALPDEEKMLQISARENEISLLQAGQFAFAKAGFALKV